MHDKESALRVIGDWLDRATQDSLEHRKLTIKVVATEPAVGRVTFMVNEEKWLGSVSLSNGEKPRKSDCAWWTTAPGPGRGGRCGECPACKEAKHLGPG